MLTNLITTLLPTYCIGCDKEGDLICDDCKLQMGRRTPSCFYCNKLSDFGRSCPACYKRTGLAGVGAAYRYENLIETMIRRLKYQNAREVSKVLATGMSAAFDSSRFDLICFVASDGRRQRKRGYNQARLLARELARMSGLTLVDALGRSSHTGQIGLNRAQRFEAVKGDFYIKRPSAIRGQRVLLVDDVCTTGATLSECARVLRSAGARSVWGVVAAKK